MAAGTLTRGRIVGMNGIVLAAIVLFVLGFVIGRTQSDEDSSENYDMKYISKKRKEEMKTKKYFHEKFLEILNANKIGENLRWVI